MMNGKATVRWLAKVLMLKRVPSCVAGISLGRPQPSCSSFSSSSSLPRLSPLGHGVSAGTSAGNIMGCASMS
ncbi:hypothetical protein ZWY2020_008819 [Hordeum vulgare]|nr:hypothetical protein ZWY2020_008819 [Hordeum vulgare]